jgi:hypothetical protein
MANADHEHEQLLAVESVDDAEASDAEATHALPLRSQLLALERLLAEGLDSRDDALLGIAGDGSKLLDGPALPLDRDGGYAWPLVETEGPLDLVVIEEAGLRLASLRQGGLEVLALVQIVLQRLDDQRRLGAFRALREYVEAPRDFVWQPHGLYCHATLRHQCNSPTLRRQVDRCRVRTCRGAGWRRIVRMGA